MNRNSTTFLIAALIAIAGCSQVTILGHPMIKDHESASSAPAAATAASTSAAPAASPAPVASQPVAPMVKSLALRLTPEAQKAGDDVTGFSVESLRITVEREFKSRRLLDGQDPRASGTAVIVVDEFATHFTSNVVVFGHSFSAGKLAGNISVRNAEGKEIRTITVTAESKLPLEDLYLKFAQAAADQYIAGPASTP
jgi:hypothetical protein